MNRTGPPPATPEQDSGSTAPPASQSFRPSGVDTVGTLPVLYARWIEAILPPGPLPVEIEATCTDCAMCARPGEPVGAGRIFFDSASKCCTYTPGLPNFLAGAILGDPSPAMAAGRASLKARLSEAPGASPLTVLPPPSYSLLYRHSQNAFGRNNALRCPHFDAASGRCTIWPYRDPTCVTWFCKHVRGKIGQSFWKALQTFLNSVVKDLSLWCVLQLDIGDSALAALESWREGEMSGENLQPNEVDGRPDAAAARKTWGRWWGRETAFYAECAERVCDLDYRDVERICGPDVQLSSRLVQRAYDRLQQTKIPAHLRVGRFTVESTASDAVRVRSYSRLDPLDLPVPVFNALSCFDGRPTADVLSAARRDRGVRLDTRMLRTLIDFGILKTGQKSKPEK
ncbi:MAG: hypothetical protein KQI81_16885 [Deltaproteobacteria bacterium]|nr:hypothetical protein [Deltaproteobacteria bacterium]